MIVIVDQKRTRVMQCERIEKSYTEISVFVGTNRYTLGIYDSEKRAQEVFNSIATEIEINETRPFYKMPKE